MIILKAIGAFFVKIWRWIRETAWVQPLLIVGAIFAVIFSIPYIMDWVESWQLSGAGAFYNSYRVSLDGETLDNESDSEADALTKMIYKYSVTLPEERGTQDIDYSEIIKEYGEKFYLAYVKDDNSESENAEKGFKFLAEHWNDSYYNLTPHDDTKIDFKLFVINASEESSNDDDYDVTANGISAFERYLTVHTDLFNITGETLLDAPYNTRASIDDTKYESYMLNPSSSTSSALSDFPVPTILLCDFSQKAVKQNHAGVSEVLFGISGDNDSDKAKLLMQMWNHTDAYSVDINNLFTKTA